MRIKIIFYLLIINIAKLAIAQTKDSTDQCPFPKLAPEEIRVDTKAQEDDYTPYVDLDRPIKDLGTDIVVKEFFNTEETLYAFMKLVYTTLDQALIDYKKEHRLDDKAIFLLFKGGNVLRMVANNIFEQVPSDARSLLSEKYSPVFKRSDADFSIYIDNRRLNNIKYEKIFSDINNLVYNNLSIIRKEFLSQPQKYFDFMRLSKEDAKKYLEAYFQELKELPLTSDKENKWYGTEFTQLQLQEYKANDKQNCGYFGQLDYRFESKNNTIIGTPLTAKPNWIVNTDNRTPEWPLGSDPQKLTKFSLGRSKIVFEYIFVKDNKIYRKPIGGELIDVSIPEITDYNLRHFLDDYDNNVAEYSLRSEAFKDTFVMKAYSLSYLAKDLAAILFNSFNRPWQGGPKYAKRVDRLFFLALVDILSQLGSGDKAKEYIHELKNIVSSLKGLYPLDNKSSKHAEEIAIQIGNVSQKWPELSISAIFWKHLAKIISERLVPSPEADDEEEFTKLIEAIDNNLDVATAISAIAHIKLKPEKVYDSNMKRLF
jgi:hypothetical protein